MTEEQTKKSEKAAGFLTNLFTGWGIQGTIARILAGAIVGAVAGWYLATSTSCTVTYTKLPDGTVHATGAMEKPVHVTK